MRVINTDFNYIIMVTDNITIIKEAMINIELPKANIIIKFNINFGNVTIVITNYFAKIMEQKNFIIN